MGWLPAVTSGIGGPQTARSAGLESHRSAGLRPSLERGEIPGAWEDPIGLSRHEKRQGDRRSLRCEMLLIGNVMDDVEEPIKIPGQCLNISNGGLYGVVPVGYGVAIGQRYTFHLATCECGPEPDSSQLVSQQGRVLRTELQIGPAGTCDRLGIAVRLYGLRSGTISMPTAALDTMW